MLTFMLAVTGLVLTVAWVARVLMIIRIVGRFYGPAIEVEDITRRRRYAAPRDATQKLRNGILHLPNAATVLQLNAVKLLQPRSRA